MSKYADTRDIMDIRAVGVSRPQQPDRDDPDDTDTGVLSDQLVYRQTISLMEMGVFNLPWYLIPYYLPVYPSYITSSKPLDPTSEQSPVGM